MMKSFRKCWYVLAGILFIWLNSNLAIAQSSSGGIALESTRIIYPSSAKNGITFTLSNRTNKAYLLQSRVLPWSKIPSSEPEFIVLPPLIRFAVDEDITLRIRLIQNILPQDRETVFILAIKAIPGQIKEESDQLVLALQNNLKLFYRPAELVNLDIIARSEKLKFYFEEGQLTVENPSPYYITFNDIKIDNISILLNNIRMVAPFSSEIYPLHEKKGKKVSWQLIDDDGNNTEYQQRLLETSVR